MKYMLLIYQNEEALDDAARGACYQESTGLAHELSAAGQFLAASPLHPTAMATSVRVRGGKRLVTDGPFAETREQLGGYFLVDAKDLDEASAKKAKEEAERLLSNRTDAIEVAEAQAQLAQAMAQLQALERLRKNLKH